MKILYFASLTGASILFGFSRSLSKIRKNDIATTEEAKLHEEAVGLARKALLKGTIYSVCGFSVFAIVSYKLFGQKLIRQLHENNNKRKDDDELSLYSSDFPK